MWPKETKTGCEYWSATPHMDKTAQISESLLGKKLPPLYRTSPFIDDECEDEELSDRLQLLSFLQYYHGVLTDHYHECGAPRPQSSSVSLTSSESLTRGCISISGFQSNTHELVPQPQVLEKRLRVRTKHRRTPLWERLRHNNRKDQQPSADGNMLPCSTEGSADSCRQHIPSILCHSEGLKANKRSAGSLGPAGQENCTHTLQGLASDSSSHGYRSLLLRLPRGFALVRLSSITTSRSEATNSCHVISREDQRQRSSAASEYP
jgi:hypothetical protein